MKTPTLMDAHCQADVLVVEILDNVSSLEPDTAREELDRVIAQLAEPEVKHAVVDFARIGHFGSLMLAALNAIGRRVRELGGRMALCNLSPTGREVIEIARFDTLWPVCATRDEALEFVRR